MIKNLIAQLSHNKNYRSHLVGLTNSVQIVISTSVLINDTNKHIEQGAEIIRQ